ncbi:hypothetical protein F5Y15DRAFT_269496 [Xylariaceae sp. FL0016]|nr:hypothetical protein F5Y15DRAFT_269496 [Xylariaceae sp. FL0016]
MWDRLNEDLPLYREESALVFWYTSHRWHSESASIIGFMLTTKQELEIELKTMLRTNGFWTRDDFNRFTQEFKVWVSARSAGLVLVDDTALLLRKGVDLGMPKCRFIHRSVREFLDGTEKGRTITNRDTRSIQERVSAVMCYWETGVFAVAGCNYPPSSATSETDSPMGVPVHLHRDLQDLMSGSVALGHEKLEEKESRIIQNYHEWMLAATHCEVWKSRVLYAAARAGFSRLPIHERKEFIRLFSLRQRSEILLKCCRDLYPLSFVSHTMNVLVMKEMEETEGSLDSFRERSFFNDPFPLHLRKVLQDHFRSIEWLLEVGADPSMIHRDARVDPKCWAWSRPTPLPRSFIFFYPITTALTTFIIALSQTLRQHIALFETDENCIASICSCMRLLAQMSNSYHPQSFTFSWGDYPVGAINVGEITLYPRKLSSYMLELAQSKLQIQSLGNLLDDVERLEIIRLSPIRADFRMVGYHVTNSVSLADLKRDDISSAQRLLYRLIFDFRASDEVWVGWAKECIKTLRPALRKVTGTRNQ